MPALRRDASKCNASARRGFQPTIENRACLHREKAAAKKARPFAFVIRW
jgi:hypothetical protein